MDLIRLCIGRVRLRPMTSRQELRDYGEIFRGRGAI
jgi:hypothetical protein